MALLLLSGGPSVVAKLKKSQSGRIKKSALRKTKKTNARTKKNRSSEVPFALKVRRSKPLSAGKIANAGRGAHDFTDVMAELKDCVKTLRGPNGCLWDKEQTLLTLIPYLIEESYELAEALRQGEPAEICEELGDVLFQVFILAELGEEKSDFSLKQVVQTIVEKIKRRHPHVFGGLKVTSVEEIKKNWEIIKQKEKELQAGRRRSKASLGEEIFKRAKGLPPLMKAHRLGEISKTWGFDWQNSEQVWLKVLEEMKELEAELKGLRLGSFEAKIENPGFSAHAASAQDSAAMKERILMEAGDVLFSISQLLRHLNMDAMTALMEANKRFESRFEKMQDLQGGDLQQFKNLEAEEKEILWQKAKKLLKNV